MTTLKTVEEIAPDTDRDGEPTYWNAWDARETLQEDRATIAAVLKERLFDLCDIDYDQDENPVIVESVKNHTIDQAIAIIDEVLTSKANK